MNWNCTHMNKCENITYAKKKVQLFYFQPQYVDFSRRINGSVHTYIYFIFIEMYMFRSYEIIRYLFYNHYFVKQQKSSLP